MSCRRRIFKYRKRNDEGHTLYVVSVQSQVLRPNHLCVRLLHAHGCALRCRVPACVLVAAIVRRSPTKKGAFLYKIQRLLWQKLQPFLGLHGDLGRALHRVTHRGEVNSSSDGHMSAGKIWIPYSVTDRLAAQQKAGEGAKIEGCHRAYLEIARVDLSASNIAKRALSRLWRWRPEPLPFVGSKSFSPRFGITGRAALFPGLRDK